jgi:hypothetical protein
MNFPTLGQAGIQGFGTGPKETNNLTDFTKAKINSTGVTNANGIAQAQDAIKSGATSDALAQMYSDMAVNRMYQQAANKELKDAAKGVKEAAGS